jgi:hypothetical protein
VTTTLPPTQLGRPGTRAGEAGGAWRRIAGRALTAVYAGCFLALPFLASSVFPSQDGPAHLHTASLLAGLRDGTSPTATRFLEEVDPGLTNTAAYWLLSRLMEVFAATRAEWAMALLLSLMLLAVVVAAPRLLGGRVRDAVVGLLLCAPVMLYMGSFALVLAMPPAFLALVFAARVARGGGAADAVTFAALALLACAAQIQVAAPLLAATFGGAAGAAGWRWLRGGGLAVPRPFLMLGLAALPVVVAAVAYAMLAPPGHTASTVRWAPLVQASILALRGDVVWFSVIDPVALAIALGVLAVAGLVWLIRAAPGNQATEEAAWRQSLWLLFASLSVAGAVMVLPRETAAVPQVPQRLAPFAHFLLFLWFIATPLPLGWRRATLASAVAAGLVLTASRSLGHAALDRRVHAEFAWAEAQIPDGSVVALLRLPAVLAVRGAALHQGGLPLRFDMVAHLGRGIAGRDVVTLSNYQLLPIWNIFRVRLRPEVGTAVPELGEFSVMIERGVLERSFEAFQAALRQATGREVEMVILWTGGVDTAEAVRSHPHLGTFLDELRAGFRQTDRSAPGGLAQIWRRMTPP